MVKFDSNGNNVWLKKVEGQSHWVLDFDSDNIGNSILVGHIIDSLQYQSATIHVSNGYDAYSLYIDENGNLIDLSKYASSGNDLIEAVACGSPGHYSVFGHYMGGTLSSKNISPIMKDINYDVGAFLFNMKNYISNNWMLNISFDHLNSRYKLRMDNDNNTYMFTQSTLESYDKTSFTTFKGTQIKNTYHVLKFDPNGKPHSLITVKNGTITDVDINDKGEIFVSIFFKDFFYLNSILHKARDYNIFIGKFDENFNLIHEYIISTPGLYGGENEVPKNQFSLFPNPVSDILNIKLTNPNIKNATIRIYNLQGIEVLRTEIIKQDHAEVDLHNLSNGMYIIMLEIPNQKSIFEKIIKQ